MNDNRTTGSLGCWAERFRSNAGSIFERVAFKEDGARSDGDISAFAGAKGRSRHLGSVAKFQPLRQFDVNAATVLGSKRVRLHGRALVGNDQAPTADHYLSTAFAARIHHCATIDV